MSGVTPGPWRVKREHDPGLHRPGGRHGYTYAIIGTGERPWVATGLSRANAHELVRLHRAAGELRAVLEDEGPRPDVHRAVLRETERRWPSLMKAVRAVVES